MPFAAGGPTDTVARLLGQAMGADLKQTVIVENVAGAGGTVGAGRVARSDPDGYTLFLHHIGHSTAPALYRKLPYNAVDDFAPIGLVTDVPMTIVARGNFPPKDLKELIDYVKKNKDKVTYANAGLGAASHLCGMLFMTAIDTDLTTVPYKGTGPAMNDLLGGKVDFMCDQTTNTTGQIKAGKIKVYAVTTKKRVPSLPDVPTAAEAGLPNFEVVVWHGLYAPKGTPKPVIDRLNAALKVALKDPTLKQALRRSRHRAGRRQPGDPGGAQARTSRRRSPCGARSSRKPAPSPTDRRLRWIRIRTKGRDNPGLSSGAVAARASAVMREWTPLKGSLS